MTALEQALADYLQLRRSLGHQLADAGRLLPRFVAFLDARGLSTVTIAAALEWAPTPTTDPAVDGRAAADDRRPRVRPLPGRHRSRHRGPAAAGCCPSRQRWRRPFIYSPADIDAIMSRAGGFTPPLRAATYDTLIGLLAATGLRIGEAIKLDRADIDWAEGVLLIRESKFGKSRLVPVHRQTLQALADYAGLRDQIQPRPPAAELLRLPHPAAAVLRRRLPDVPAAVVDDSGIGSRTRHGGPGCTTSATLSPSAPCSAGTAPVRTSQAKIPALSTYLGHREPGSTYWYLSAVPELLACAATRQEASAAVTS